MIPRLSIRNFKSVRQLDLDCRRVNVFIGEPNTGKTNILEGLGLWCGEVVKHLHEVTRSNILADLYWEQNVSSPIEVHLGDRTLSLAGSPDGAEAVWRDDLHRLPGEAFSIDNELRLVAAPSLPNDVRFYRYFGRGQIGDPHPHALLPPFGQNLAALLYSNKTARAVAKDLFERTGYQLQLEIAAREIRVTRAIDDLLFSIPFSSVSETLRRMLFLNLAIDTNQDQVLVFDEPEAHAFPPYTKTLAERIALDDRGNQFFLTTHSPYMLDSLLSKTPEADLNVVLCRMENFETKAYPMNQDQIDQIKEWSMDAFFNFDRLLPEVE